MASTHSPTASPDSASAAAAGAGPDSGRAYKRASRKGAARRFSCDHPGCDKLYSRYEHLQRHQLNHNPKEIFGCDVVGCDQKFVRLDLLARHKKRHTASYTPRNRLPSFNEPRESVVQYPQVASPEPHQSQRTLYSHPQSGGPHDADILLTPNSNIESSQASFSQQLASRQSHSTQPWTPSLTDRAPPPLLEQKNSFFGAEPTPLPQPSMVPFPAVSYSTDEEDVQANFAAWLFDPQTSYTDFNVANLPFLEGGLESAFNNNIHYDYEPMGRSSVDHNTPPRYADAIADDQISESRRAELVTWFRMFCKKQPRYDPLMPTLLQESGGDLVALNTDMMRDCVKEFWDTISPRLPIIHQHTFSPNRCPIFLLFVMIALGAASLRNRHGGHLIEYGAFADVIMSSVRWEIQTADDAAPPVSLWVAQAWLLLEFYETLYSSRRFHERAHIYHSAFLTLLRRGSPLIGRAGSESPPEGDGLASDRANAAHLDSRTWWVRWAETESMHRVVFAAFMLDTIHAVMFGHNADMMVHEIRLPLPSDDNLWMASSPDEVRQLDANFRMYGVKQVTFLDGLKNALHGKEVKTHAFGRMIIVAGLLSVGWHLNHQQSHLKWLDMRGTPSETQDSWRKMLLKAFDSWKESFDHAMSDSLSDAMGARRVPNGPISSASVLYHLAHLSLHSDFVDCQVYNGAKRLMGRKISTRDYHNAVKRMNAWAKQASTRHAILHAFKLLYRILVEPNSRRRGSMHDAPVIQYSIRSDPDPNRPWIMYFATLNISSFVQALGRPPGKGFPYAPHRGLDIYGRVADYLASVAALATLDEKQAAMLHEGVPGLLDVVERILREADTELLREAQQRLKVCRELLLGGTR
ncbi:zinc finger, C2H2 type domain-containing protein [Stachybotrys elegans]|uniref:Zinc finger, C2H2 type domain-containing protein n=1 Tax=Stachybotrys elegans TaxID=80388 RepID=A0A8K0SRF1_9HYPO|nr:zinc finger, C2H2 type domain-containing protein [Stachybotrys elegans]